MTPSPAGGTPPARHLPLRRAHDGPRGERGSGAGCLHPGASGTARVRGDSSFRTWLYRIARNRCCSELRGRGRRIETVPLTADDEETMHPLLSDSPPDFADDIARKDVSARVTELVAALPLPYRQVLTLFYIDEMQYEEIAAVLDVPMGTVKTWLIAPTSAARSRRRRWHPHDSENRTGDRRGTRRRHAGPGRRSPHEELMTMDCRTAIEAVSARSGALAPAERKLWMRMRRPVPAVAPRQRLLPRSMSLSPRIQFRLRAPTSRRV